MHSKSTPTSQHLALGIIPPAQDEAIEEAVVGIQRKIAMGTCVIGEGNLEADGTVNSYRLQSADIIACMRCPSHALNSKLILLTE